MGSERLPNVRAVILWSLFTWAAAVVGCVAAIWSHNWVAVAFAINAASLAAAHWLACERWVEWRALAETYVTELIAQAGHTREPRDDDY
jgi:hypothetical protein